MIWPWANDRIMEVTKIGTKAEKGNLLVFNPHCADQILNLEIQAGDVTCKSGLVTT